MVKKKQRPRTDAERQATSEEKKRAAGMYPYKRWVTPAEGLRLDRELARIRENENE